MGELITTVYSDQIKPEQIMIYIDGAAFISGTSNKIMYYCDGTNWHAKYTADNIKKEEAIEEDDAGLKYL
jgi:hypothetical protein